MAVCGWQIASERGESVLDAVFRRAARDWQATAVREAGRQSHSVAVAQADRPNTARVKAGRHHDCPDGGRVVMRRSF